MANILKKFQMERDPTLHSFDGDDETRSHSVMDYVRHPGRLLSRPLSAFKGHDEDEEHGELKRGNSRKTNGELKRGNSRKNTQKAAMEVMKDGVSMLQRNIKKKMTRFKMTPAGNNSSEESHGSSPKATARRESETSVDSMEGSSGDGKDFRSFSKEVKKAVSVHLFNSHLQDSVKGEDEKVDNEVRHIIHKWNEILEMLISEVWRIAERVFKHQRQEAELVKERAHEAERRCREAHASYQKEITSLRDQIRNLPRGVHEALRCTFFSPLCQHDASTRELVLACVEERIKELFAQSDQEGSMVNWMLHEKVEPLKCELEVKSGEFVKKEKQRFERILDDERDAAESEREALQRQIAQMEGQIVQMQEEAELQKAAKEDETINAALAENSAASISSGDNDLLITHEEELRKSIAEAATLRHELELARLAIGHLSEKMAKAGLEASATQILLEAERRARTEKSAEAERSAPLKDASMSASDRRVPAKCIKGAEDTTDMVADAAESTYISTSAATSRAGAGPAGATDQRTHAVQGMKTSGGFHISKASGGLETSKASGGLEISKASGGLETYTTSGGSEISKLIPQDPERSSVLAKSEEFADSTGLLKSKEFADSNAPERRPVLPGASAFTLMEHATWVHETLDIQKTGSSTTPAKDLLNLLERVYQQLEVEVQQEAANTLPEAFEGSTVVAMLLLHAHMASRHGSGLLPLAMLLMNSISELCSLAQGKVGAQIKVSALSKQLLDIRNEAQRLLSALFSGTQRGLDALQGLRSRLKNSLQLDDRGIEGSLSGRAGDNSQIEGIEGSSEPRSGVGGKAAPNSSASHKAKARGSQQINLDLSDPALQQPAMKTLPAKGQTPKAGGNTPLSNKRISTDKRTSTAASIDSSASTATPSGGAQRESSGLSLTGVAPTTPKAPKLQRGDSTMGVGVVVTPMAAKSNLVQKKPNLFGRRAST